MTRKMLLVTGASGFLGSHLLRRLPDADDAEVLAVVRAPAGLAALPPTVTGVVADLSRPDAAARLRDAAGARPVRLIHLAGAARTPTMRLLFETNVRALLTVLTAVGPRLEHVTLAGSVAVYGDVNSAVPCPGPGYGAAKLLAEEALELFAAASGVPVAVLRMASLYGPGNVGGNAVDAVTTAAAAGTPFLIGPAPVLYARDYLHVTDAARAVCRAVRSAFAGTVDVGTGTASTPRDLAALLRRSGENLVVDDRAAGAAVVAFACDTAAARDHLGLTEPIPLTRGLPDELAWRRAR